MQSDTSSESTLSPRTPPFSYSEHYLNSPRSTLTPGFLIRGPPVSFPIPLVPPYYPSVPHNFGVYSPEGKPALQPAIQPALQPVLQPVLQQLQPVPPFDLLHDPGLGTSSPVDDAAAAGGSLAPPAPLTPVTGQSVNLFMYSPQYVSSLSSVEVLRLVTQCMPVDSIVIPPSPNEQPLSPHLPATGKQPQWRALYIDGLPSYVAYCDLMRMIRPVPLEASRLTTDYTHGTARLELRFLSYYKALRFYAESLLNPIVFDGQQTTVSWALAPPISDRLAVQIRSGATRKVRITFNDRFDAPASIHEKLSILGPIESVIEDAASSSSTSTWTVSFASLESAVGAIPVVKEAWPDAEARFLKDSSGCASQLHRLEQQAALLYLGESPYETRRVANYNAYEINEALTFQYLAAILTAQIRGGMEHTGNRCVCISKLPDDTKLLDICNVVRGGMLESVKILKDLNVGFVTFVEPTAAAQFWATYQMKRLNVNGESVRIGWGRNPGPLDPEIRQAVGQGITRNLCLKWLAKPGAEARSDGQSRPDRSELERVFSVFGTIEQIRIAPEISCSFVSFTDIKNTIQAVNWACESHALPNVSVQYGKDRCATLPRITEHENEPILVQFLRRAIMRTVSQCNRSYGGALSPGIPTSAGY